MVTSSQIARAIAANVLTHPSFTSSAIMQRQTEGHRDEHGEFIEGAAVETPVSLVHVPISGQERLVVPEGLRDDDVQKFFILGDVPSFRYGLTDGDRIVLGALGQAQNRFTGANRQEAERARDQYAVANATWFVAYQSSETSMIQLRGFGSPIYQRYDATDGHWINSDVYRAFSAQRWGAFSDVLAVRIDPGNL